MFDYDLELNIDQELSEIPPEFQDAFRQAITRELADTEQNRTDTDILNYLRSRRDDFKRGGFIRPDGRPGLVALNPDTMYEQALPQLAQSSLGELDHTAERRRTLIKMGVFVGVVLVFLFFVFRGRAQQREEDQAATAEVTPVAAVAGTAAPTPPLPEITGVEDSLQTIGSLGGALTIGRPSAIELHYGRTEETIALAIDPSKPTPKGELRYNEATMLSDNPVAVWLFGTVLNYAIGIPDSMVRNLAPGDRLTLSTDTGVSLHFVVAETGQGANYEAGRLLSQNRLGLTLFALPAVAEDDVAFAFANYDVASEEGQRQVVYEVGDTVALGAGGELQVTAVQYSHTEDGSIRIGVEGALHNLSDSHSVLLSLTSSHEQTTAVPLIPAANGLWQASYTLPDSVTGLPYSAGATPLSHSELALNAVNWPALFAEFRTLPDGNLVVVQLGEAPRLTEQLSVEITGAWWDGERGQAMMAIAIHNPGQGAVYIGPEFIQIPTEGGDADEKTWQVTPRLPILINPGETRGITATFLPLSASVRLQIGADLWEVAD
ncbi:MAG TPA: hypothetical protein PLK31_16930, partial [Chloroflexota bacterium]|nr:hypothetical protein [Chloroflexota bacterium]